MASSINLTEAKVTYTINAEQITYVEWAAGDGDVKIHFGAGEPLTFTNLTARDRDGLKRMMRVTPV